MLSDLRSLTLKANTRLLAELAKRRVTLKTYAHSTMTLLTSAAAQFTWFIVLARALGVNQFAGFIMINALTTILASVCGVGAGDAIMRRIARDRSHYPLMLGHAIILIIASGAVLCVGSTLGLSFLVKASNMPVTNAAIMFAFSVANILLFTWVTLVEQIFIGFQDFRTANLANVGFSLTRLLTAVVACLICGVHTLAGWSVWIVAGNGVASFGAVYLLRRQGRPIWKVDIHELKLGFHFSLPFLIDCARQNIDRFVLGIAVPIAVVGSYGTAARMSQTSQIVIWALNRIAYPKLSRMRLQAPNVIIAIVSKYCVAACGVSVLCAAAIFFLAPTMPILLGPSYTGVVTDLRTLCWSIIPAALLSVPYSALGALDRHAMRGAVYNVLNLSGALLTGVLVWKLGVKGAFAAAYLVPTSIAIAIWTTLYLDLHRQLRTARAELNSRSA